MKVGTLTEWAKRGWLLDEIVLAGPGEIINSGCKPHYIGGTKERGYVGNAQPIIVSRYAMGIYLGRPLTRNELLRFRGENKQDLRLSNLILHSKTATSVELFKANGFVLGYSHCLCGCGTALDLAKQKQQPYAFAEGHRPKSKGDQANPKRARQPMAKVLVEKLTKKEAMPITQIQGGYPIPIPEPETVEPPDEPLKEYRMLFEKMIHQLRWVEFKELLQLLLEIQTRKK